MANKADKFSLRNVKFGCSSFPICGSPGVSQILPIKQALLGALLQRRFPASGSVRLRSKLCDDTRTYCSLSLFSVTVATTMAGVHRGRQRACWCQDEGLWPCHWITNTIFTPEGKERETTRNSTAKPGQSMKRTSIWQWHWPHFPVTHHKNITI